MFTPLQQNLINEVKAKHPGISYRKLSRLLLQQSAFAGFTNDSLRLQLAWNDNNKNAIVEQFETTALEIPESLYEPPELAEVTGKIGVINDIHLPFHDKNALQMAINYLHEENIDTLLLNGDIVDFYAVSRFVRNPNFRDLNREITIANQFLDYLQTKFNNIIYKEGNHEVRLVAYIAEKAPEMSNIDTLTLPSLLHLKERGIKFIDNRGILKAGKLGIIHGNEITNGGLINVARVKILRAMENILFGHHHVTQDFMQRKIFGDTIGAYSVGCLCGLNPEYAKINGWNHGFALVEVFDDKSFEVTNKKIINYKIM